MSAEPEAAPVASAQSEEPNPVDLLVWPDISAWKVLKSGNRVYYFHIESKKSQWVQPPEVEAWDKVKAEETEILAKLMKDDPIWVARRDRFGRTQYQNKETKEKTEDKPYHWWTYEEKKKKRDREEALRRQKELEEEEAKRKAKISRIKPSIAQLIADIQKQKTGVETKSEDILSAEGPLEQGQDSKETTKLAQEKFPPLPFLSRRTGEELSQFFKTDGDLLPHVALWDARRAVMPRDLPTPTLTVWVKGAFAAATAAAEAKARAAASAKRLGMVTSDALPVAPALIAPVFTYLETKGEDDVVGPITDSRQTLDVTVVIPTNPALGTFDYRYYRGPIQRDVERSGYNTRRVTAAPYIAANEQRQAELEKAEEGWEPSYTDEQWTAFWATKKAAKEEMHSAIRLRALGY